MASRIAARSTTAGTPVKSCISTRAGREGDLLARLRVGVPGRPAPRCPRRGSIRRPRCAAGSRAGSSARTAAARRRSAPGARRGGRSRSARSPTRAGPGVKAVSGHFLNSWSQVVTPTLVSGGGNPVAPRVVTGGCCARTRAPTRSGATRGRCRWRSQWRDAAQRRQGPLECHPTDDSGH